MGLGSRSCPQSGSKPVLKYEGNVLKYRVTVTHREMAPKEVLLQKISLSKAAQNVQDRPASTPVQPWSRPRTTIKQQRGIVQIKCAIKLLLCASPRDTRQPATAAYPFCFTFMTRRYEVGFTTSCNSVIGASRALSWSPPDIGVNSAPITSRGGAGLRVEGGHA
ncbi:hypothetical protein EVAR_91567_1 [Eumeta japonica]|uniref:Uncharacterized protein n=1 Tax=Eumeta variegata TaxID=151549 RepID=A0A4C1XDM1_EUMVA|nr:hypothetical protein EVAR_91567_1 [Eumeta japonica]